MPARTRGSGPLALAVAALIFAVPLLASPVTVAGEGSASSAAAPALTTGRPSAAPAPVTSIDAAPTGLREAAAAAIGAAQTRFHVQRGEGALVASGGGLETRFDRTGVSVATGGAQASFRMVGLGHGPAPALPASSPVASGNRVTYRRGGVSEWYANGPLGLEQGFTLASRPAGGDGWLTVAEEVSGGLVPRKAGSAIDLVRPAGGSAVLTYGALSAFDATGRALPARLGLAGRKLLLGIDDRRAVYPLTIDPTIQQGSMLTPSDSLGGGLFGYSVALASNGGATALIGAPSEAGLIGAAWVFTRSGSTWTQQAKLVPVATPAIGVARFGTSVALSANGNIAMIGAPNDNSGQGAVWVFTRSGGLWTEVSKITPPPNENGTPQFGTSVSLSDSGGTAIIGGPGDSAAADVPDSGAAWIFDGSLGWGESAFGVKKLVPSQSPETGAGAFGWSVSISGDATTAVIGAPHDKGSLGKAWIFANTDGWLEQGGLTGSDEAGNPGEFGWSVSISQDGKTALVGSPTDDPSGDGSNAGAAWVFLYSPLNSTWNQYGSKLLADSGAGSYAFGWSVAMSSDAGTALIGGLPDPPGHGAAWEFKNPDGWIQDCKQSPTEQAGYEAFGFSVALSSDGDTQFVGGPYGGDGNGGAWAFGAGPCVSNESATVIDDVSAEVFGTVDPHGDQTTYAVEYGKTTEYGQSTSDQGPFTTVQSVDQEIAGLEPATVYHYRIAATSFQGTAYGADETFTTGPQLTGIPGVAVSGVVASGAGCPDTTASIDWGDNGTSQGTIDCHVVSDQFVFTVSGSHGYAAPGHYSIIVSLFGGDKTYGAGALITPENDAFANATILQGNQGSLPDSNVDATVQPGEPDPTGGDIANTVWYAWTPTASGPASFRFQAAFGGSLAVYTGSALNSLTELDDDYDGTSLSVSFAAVADTTYYIQVGAYFDPPGSFNLDWALPPPNDDWVDAAGLPSQPTGSTSGSNVGATNEPGEPLSLGATAVPTGLTVWWKWVAPSDGQYAFDTSGTDFDTVLGVFTGSSVSSLTEVTSNDDGGTDLTSRAAFQAAAGTTYYIQVGGYDGDSSGSIVLGWRSLAPQAYVVTTTGDTVNDANCLVSSCTLRQAVNAADGGNGADSITVPAGVYQLSTGFGALVVSTGVTITGDGARTTKILGPAVADRSTQGDRVFDVTSTASPVLIQGFTLSGGSANPENGCFGGNVRNAGNLTLLEVTVTDGAACSGGGVSNDGGTLLVERSTVSGNNALFGGGDSGGIQNFGDNEIHHGALTISDSTISSNTARLGGGILSWNDNANTTVIRNSTIALNHATDRGLGGMGGQGTFTVGATIVSGNTFAAAASNCDTESTTIVSAGSNLESGTDCGFTAGGDHQSTDPKLGALGDNGGPTDTQALPATSPALDAVVGDCPPPAMDQRGVTRPQGSACDIGAFELAVQAPANDNFANAAAIQGVGSLEGSNVGGTVQQGEPDPTGGDIANTVWYAWTPAVGGPASFLFDADFLGSLAVYTGSALGSLTEVKQDYDDTQLTVSFTAVAGTTYYIQVGAYFDSPGPFTLSLTTAPGAPTGVSAVPGNGQATVSFTAPASDGGSAITSYTVTASPGGATASGAASPIVVPGLTNGTAYTFTVTATNAIGTGAASSPSSPVTPATVPGAPTGVSAVAGNAQASVSFTAPTSNGGSAITSYTVTASPGGATASGAASPIVVPGLTNGTAYTFTVTATNAAGTGAASSPSSPVTPATVPGAPTGVSAVAGNAQASVSFTAPTSNGGSAITSYTVTASPGGATASGAASPIVVPGLSNGTAYTFTVTATNSVGTSAPSSPSSPVTPATVPGAPTGVSAVAGNAQASVSFTAPASNGGAAITSYTVTASPGGATASGAASPIVVPGLANGTAYTFTVTATNSAGTGAASSPSSPVTPITVPGAPTGVSAVAGNAQASVSFTAPASNGGAAISSYTVTASPGGATASGAASPIAVPGLANGTAYTFTVTATNAAGTGAPSSASSAVTPLAPPTIVGEAASSITESSAVVSASINPNGAATTFSVEFGATAAYGQQTPPVAIGSGTSIQVVDQSLSGLGSGTTHHYRFVTTNAGGTTLGPDATFTTATPPPVPVAPIPGQPAAPTPLPPPVQGLSADIIPAVGTVLVNGKPLVVGQPIPFGSTVDVTNGTVILQTIIFGVIQEMQFAGGVFQVFQLPNGVTQLVLKGGDFSVCKPAKKSKVKKNTTRLTAAGPPKKTIRLLWGNGKGKFQTKGRYAAATVRGTIYMVADRCDGTLVRVKRGIVTVDDFGSKKTKLVIPGKDYLAKP